MNTATSPALYLMDAIADEITIAKLLGWTVSTVPIEYYPTVYLRGSKGSAFTSRVGPAMTPSPMVFMPQWRRSHAVFELVVMCNINLVVGDKHVAAAGGEMYEFTVPARVADHPTKDDAIRYVICKAAIKYLTAKAAK